MLAVSCPTVAGPACSSRFPTCAPQNHRRTDLALDQVMVAAALRDVEKLMQQNGKSLAQFGFDVTTFAEAEGV